MGLKPKRTVAELKELRSFTSDENGAQRVAFTQTWIAARDWLKKKLETLPVEILRRISAQYNGKPPITVRLVDWADEEGARFGKSLFGSSACSGNLNMDEARVLKDKDGVALPDALKEIGINFERVKDSGKELKNAAAYIELHIEQGPVLLDLDLPLGAVLGTFGVERHAITF